MRAIAFAMVALTSACGGAPTKSDGRIMVVTTISTFNSLVEAVGGARVQVQNLVPVGASPETFQPTPQDAATLAQAQLLVENGAGLEAWLQKTVANTGSTSLRTVVCTNGLPIRENNPHLWMDPVYAKQYVLAIRNGLTSVDPAHGAEYRANAGRYLAKLDALRVSIERRIGRIAPERRLMIGFHNAFTYYNLRFGITSLGFIEMNPGQDPNPQQIARLIDMAKARDLHAIFSEPEYSAKLAQQIASGAGIRIVDNLYDDSIGTDPRVRDYFSMLNYDTDVIVKALQ